MRDFWLSCGHHLVDRDAGRGLVVTDEFLKTYLARPEMVPPPDACVAEHKLHAALLAEPRRDVLPGEVAALRDDDARENWELMIAFRDHLLRHRTLEGAYIDLARHGVGKTPPLFLNQLVHVILRNALDETDDVFVLRAAELMFRRQRMAVHDGSLIAADADTAMSLGTQSQSPLISLLGVPTASNIDVLNDDNADSYWERSDAFDMALDLTAKRRGLASLGVAMERWIEHMLGVEVDIEAVPEMRDVSLNWYVGLDAVATQVGDTLWSGADLDEATQASIVGLYKLRFRNPDVADVTAGEGPVPLILAMTPDKVLHMKPQNLLTGLPIRRLEMAN